MRNRFTLTDDLYLLEYHNQKEVREMAKFLQRDESSVNNRLKILGLSRKYNRKPWNNDEDNILRQNLSMNRKELGQMLNRSESAVNYRIHLLHKKKILFRYIV